MASEEKQFRLVTKYAPDVCVKQRKSLLFKKTRKNKNFPLTNPATFCIIKCVHARVAKLADAHV